MTRSGVLKWLSALLLASLFYSLAPRDISVHLPLYLALTAGAVVIRVFDLSCWRRLCRPYVTRSPTGHRLGQYSYRCLLPGHLFDARFSSPARRTRHFRRAALVGFPLCFFRGVPNAGVGLSRARVLVLTSARS